MNRMVVSSGVHVPACVCFVIAHAFFLLFVITLSLVFQGVSPFIPIDLWWFFNFPIFHALPFSPLPPVFLFLHEAEGGGGGGRLGPSFSTPPPFLH